MESYEALKAQKDAMLQAEWERDPKTVALRAQLSSAHAGIVEEQRLCALRCKGLAEQLAERDRAIAEFCARSAWAVESWRQQPHIKALFDLAGLAGKKEE